MVGRRWQTWGIYRERVDERARLHPVRLICPVCNTLLQSGERTWRCPTGHTFDVAREGYLNLWLPRRRPKFAGDAPTMLQARRAFLQAGHYEPLAEAVTQRVHDHLVEAHRMLTEAPGVLDVGCGEGYYLNRLQTRLNQLLPATTIDYLGMDIAKDGVRLAARQSRVHKRPPLLFVGDVTKQILLADASVRVMLNLFAPRNPAEFSRVMQVGGLLLIVIPTASHLHQLRQHFNLIGLRDNKRAEIIAQLQPDFALVATQTIGYSLILYQPDLTHLVQMTPNYRHLSPAQWEAIKETAYFETGGQFQCSGL